MNRALAVSLFAAMMATAASAQQKPTPPPTVAPIPPATPVQQRPTSPSTVTDIPLAPAAQQKPTPAPAPRTATPAQPAPPAQPATPAPLPATPSYRPQPVNFRIEVQVTDRQDGKVSLSETFTAVVADGSNSRISRVTPAPMTASLELNASSLGSPSADTVRTKIVAQFKLPNNVDVGQEITSFIVLGKPSTVIDIASGADGARRFVVQVTVVRAPLE